ncbi:MCE family protein [Mycobacterium sp. 1465703.0]|uniref:MCE family protein n=1 Tax=Mycobacterium sp. 1465703.0 TaxID=1834078 RepID=UPI0007FE5FB2|nr:MCE family protein [Mycobacterium sp. 1465703.0]OBJ08853.1 mammalian cell entry protein [Mycobacterium sp. 1465703.0]
MTVDSRGQTLAASIWRLGAFGLVCALGIFALVAIFNQSRFDNEVPYRAQFSNVTGLRSGDFVRIAGVEVGKVKHISIGAGAVALVEFSIDTTVHLTHASRAVIRYENVVGNRYLELQEGAGDPRRLAAGSTIPLVRTEPALDLDALVGGFRPLLRALDPNQVNKLSIQLIQAFQGQGATISSVLDNVAALSNSLADRDQLIGDVIANLKTILGELDDQSQQFDSAVKSLSDLVGGLVAKKEQVAHGIAYTNAAASTLADLLVAARPGIKAVVHEGDRVATIVANDRDYLDNLLDTLPDSYKVLARQGLYGDFFSYYLCDLFLKVNGKGGNPVYIKVAGQSTGRCSLK